MNDLPKIVLGIIGAFLFWGGAIVAMILLALAFAYCGCTPAHAASQPSHVKRLSRYLYFPAPEPTLPEPSQPLTWQEEWIIERSLAIQMRAGHPLDLPLE